jgi:hypothetical protein
LSILRSFGQGAPFSGLDERLQAQQERTPLGAAMVHELHRLLPALVLEQDDGPLTFLFEIKTYFCADPFLGPVDHLPQHAPVGIAVRPRVVVHGGPPGIVV